MTGRRIKEAKKCKVCGKVIRDQNKSGLCGHHYRLLSNKKIIKKRKENHLCIQCGKKVEPTIIYPAGKTIPSITKYFVRCCACRKKYKDYIKERIDKTFRKEVKLSTSLDARRSKMYRKRKKENHICIQCGEKVEPTIIYPAGKTTPPNTTYAVRCYACKNKQRNWSRKQKTASVTPL